MLLAVNLGGDTDTIGAIYGQLAGAYYGYDDIPKKWREIIARKTTVNEMASDLFRLSHTILKIKT